MYHFLEDAVTKSLVEKTEVKKKIDTSLLENEEEKENNDIDNNYNIIVNVNVKQLKL